MALICCESLGLDGADYSRGYIQNWLAGNVIPEKSAQKIFHAADQILRAGQSSPVQLVSITAEGGFTRARPSLCFSYTELKTELERV